MAKKLVTYKLYTAFRLSVILSGKQENLKNATAIQSQRPATVISIWIGVRSRRIENHSKKIFYMQTNSKKLQKQMEIYWKSLLFGMAIAAI